MTLLRDTIQRLLAILVCLVIGASRAACRHILATMAVVTVSPKYQVVIPQRLREALGLKPGQKIEALQYLDRVEFIPGRSIRAMRGFLKGLDSTVPRGRDRA